MPVYEKFEALLTKAQVSTYQVSKATGIPASTFSDWKKGRSRPKFEKLQKLAQFFNVPIEAFFEEASTDGCS